MYTDLIALLLWMIRLNIDYQYSIEFKKGALSFDRIRLKIVADSGEENRN